MVRGSLLHAIIRYQSEWLSDLLLQMMFIVTEGTAVISLLATSYFQARSAAEFVRQLPRTNVIQYRSSLTERNGPGGI
ncbi:MAG TPA: hypothetical protein VFG77_03910 [Nitrososphaeraceae archaeon]|nr:hypothetical protein [Nitrososphaeraceae archaeon]